MKAAVSETPAGAERKTTSADALVVPTSAALLRRLC